MNVANAPSSRMALYWSRAHSCLADALDGLSLPNARKGLEPMPEASAPASLATTSKHRGQHLLVVGFVGVGVCHAASADAAWKGSAPHRFATREGMPPYCQGRNCFCPEVAGVVRVAVYELDRNPSVNV